MDNFGYCPELRIWRQDVDEVWAAFECCGRNYSFIALGIYKIGPWYVFFLSRDANYRHNDNEDKIPFHNRA